jgi:hypothetical protein
VCGAVPQPVEVVPLTSVRYGPRGEIIQWDVHFRLERAAGTTGGYVVQHMVRTIRQGGRLFQYEAFWEVFFVPPGGTETSPSQPDRYSITVSQPPNGRVHFVGRCWYYELTDADLVSVGFHPVRLETYRRPCFWQPGGAPHELHYSFDERTQPPVRTISTVPPSTLQLVPPTQLLILTPDALRPTALSERGAWQRAIRDPRVWGARSCAGSAFR